MKLIGLRGQSGVGKTYISDVLLAPKGYAQWGIAFFIKLEVAADLLLEGIASSPAEAARMVFVTKPEAVRRALQGGRPEKDREAHGTGVHRRLCAAFLGIVHANNPDARIAVTDIRTLDDAEWLDAMGGVVLDISAPGRLKDTGLQNRLSAKHFTEQGAAVPFPRGIAINNNPAPPVPLVDQVLEGIASRLGHEAATPATQTPALRPGGRIYQIAWETAVRSTDDTPPRVIMEQAARRFQRSDDGIGDDFVVIGQRRGGSLAWGEAYERVLDAAWPGVWEGTPTVQATRSPAPRAARR